MTRLLILALLFLTWSSARASAHESMDPQERAIKRIKELGGKVELENNTIVKVTLGSSDVSDDDLATLVEGMPQVQDLRLEKCHITDVGVKHLSKLQRLRALKLDFTMVSDD